MVKSKRLTPIKKLALNKEKEAAQALGLSLEMKEVELQKLAQLEQYRLEYLADMENKIKQGLSGSTLLQYHHFLSKLDLAITQQKTVLVACEDKLTTVKDNWQNKRSKAKVISQVMEKMVVQEQKKTEKRESMQSDELSTMAFIRRQTVNNGH